MKDEHFTLALPAIKSDVLVVSLTGQEAMNALFRFDARVLVEAEEGAARRLVGTPASLAIRFNGDVARAVHGIIASCRATGRSKGGATAFVVQLVPRMARLEHRKSSRIFQDRTAREVVEQVLAFSRIQNRWLLDRELPRRAYCVQYEETDYAFVTRILASEGIFFSFDHPLEVNGGAVAEEVLVLSDTADGYAMMDGRSTLRFRPADAGGSALNSEEDHVHDFGLGHAMRPNRILFRSFDFTKPSIPRRDAAGSGTASTVDGAVAMRSFVDDEVTIYEHQLTREEAVLDPLPAKVALEAETADAAMAEGETPCRRLVPGRRFRLIDHEIPEFDGDYVIVACTHEGSSPQWTPAGRPIYVNHFTAVPADIPFRPERPRRAIRQTLETATVVGPRGHEIHTDEHGRIKVQFHWDLEGEFDEKSSCWLRVVQPWAGSIYGAQFLPRVGSEVLVGYIDGDADRPVVLGCLHNGVNLTPFALPQESERSGIKTRSSPGGAGGHELLFDDQAGQELVALRSNRTMHISAAEDSTLSADQNLRITAGGSRVDEVLGDASTAVSGDEQRATGRGRSATVGGNEAVEIKGHRDARVGGNDMLRVDGAALHIISGSRSTIVGTDATAPADESVGVTGQYRVASAHEMRLSSGKALQIACGDSKITLYPDRILIESPTIQLQAKERIALVQGDPPAATLTLAGSAALGGGTVSVVGGGEGGGKLFLDGDAHLNGGFVKLNCGPMGGAAGDVIEETAQKGTVQFTVSPEGIPPGVQSVVLVIATPTGEVVERLCAVGGTVIMEGNAGDVFTIVETRIGDSPVTIQKTTKGG